MNAPEKIFLPDAQSNPDRRTLAIQRVGVEDITHPLAVEALDAVAACTVESGNFESIHNHSAYALIERVKP